MADVFHWISHIFNIVDKTKYMIMSRDQNAGRSDSMKIDNNNNNNNNNINNNNLFYSLPVWWWLKLGNMRVAGHGERIEE